MHCLLITQTIRGATIIIIALKLLLKGKAIVALKGQTDNPKIPKYVFLHDNLSAQRGNFYTDDKRSLY